MFVAQTEPRAASHEEEKMFKNSIEGMIGAVAVAAFCGWAPSWQPPQLHNSRR